MKKNFTDIIYEITLHLVSVLIIVNVVLLICCMLNFIFKLSGFEFNGFISLILFFLYSVFVRLPMSIVSKEVSNILLSFRILNLFHARILFVILSITTSVIAMGIVDYFMMDINASSNFIIAFAIATTLLSVKKIKPKQE